MCNKKIPSNHHEKVHENVKFSVIIVSDRRYQQSKAGKPIQDLTIPITEKVISKYSYGIQSRLIVPDDKNEILRKLSSLLDENDSEIILTSGGTGIGPRDVTIETIQPLFEKEITGFGELFRYISYEEIGPAAMLSRATAGIIKSKLIFILPGNPNAVELALKKLILPEIDHMLNMIGK
ncbi:MAG: molybdenum cofactor biosynthesis protein MoaB [Candidatus Helarchaeota archaeon]|nr:molybdenum cofactor biosynthesis protein MoaB [Candidatus Helarchaeota archaeon]